MPKILNIDAMLPEQQFIHLDGIDHAVSPATTAMYMELLRKKQKNKGEPTELEQAEMTLDLLNAAIPTVTKARLAQLPMQVLIKISEVVQAGIESDEAEEEANGESGE